MKRLVVALLLFAAVPVFAQVQDPFAAMVDPAAQPDSNSVDSLLGNGDSQPAEAAVKPYERIVLNFDSTLNLITYNGVVEEPEASSDSLYFYAKQWAVKTFPGGGKALFELDKKAQKLIINGFLPAFSYANKYSARPIGRYYFKMTILFKEERYKYTISNLVHEASKGNTGSAARNYFEYYYTTTTNIKGSDQILRYADKDINKMIEEFKKALKKPAEVNEDDW